MPRGVELSIVLGRLAGVDYYSSVRTESRCSRLNGFTVCSPPFSRVGHFSMVDVRSAHTAYCVLSALEYGLAVFGYLPVLKQNDSSYDILPFITF